MAILKNAANGSVVLHAVANTTWVIAGNNSVSNVAIGDEVVSRASIKQAWFGSPSGSAAYWTVQRGANTVAVFDSTAWIDFAGNGMALNLHPEANLTVTLTGSAGNGHPAVTGYIQLELKKEIG